MWFDKEREGRGLMQVRCGNLGERDRLFRENSTCKERAGR